MSAGTVDGIHGLELLGDEDGLSERVLDRLPVDARLAADLRQRIRARRTALETVTSATSRRCWCCWRPPTAPGGSTALLKP
jgi:hypothetical protein